MRSRRALLIPAALTVVMAVLGFWGLARDNAMGNDEVVSSWAATLTFPQLWHLIGHIDAVHGLDYALLHVWSSVSSGSPAALRVPSVVAAALAVGVVTALARKLETSLTAAITSGLVMAFTPSIAFYAQTARSYAIVLLCVAAATAVFVSGVDREQSGQPAVRWWVAYALLTALAGYLNEMALLMVVAHAITLLLSGAGRRTSVRWGTSAVVGGLSVVPLLLISVREDDALAYLTQPGMSMIRAVAHDYFGTSAVLAFVLMLFAVAGALRLPQRGLTAATVGLPLLVAPPVVLFVVSLLTRPLFVDRYVLWGEIGAALLVGAGAAWLEDVVIARNWPRPVAWSAAAVLCLVTLVAQMPEQHQIRRPQSREWNFAAPADVIAAHAHHGDGVLFFDDFFRKTRLGYPDQFRNVDDIASRLSPAAAGRIDGVDLPLPQVLTAMDQRQRIWVVGRKPSTAHAASSGSDGQRISAESEVLFTQFTRQSTYVFPNLTVTLWQRRSTA